MKENWLTVDEEWMISCAKKAKKLQKYRTWEAAHKRSSK